MEGGQAVSGVNISICDGKYTVIQAPTGTTRVLRYGEEWRDVTGDNVIGGLAWELQEARDRIKRLEEAGDYLCAAAAFMGWHDKIEAWRKAKDSQ
jgi:uncharacterized heparinase superfamily protein